MLLVEDLQRDLLDAGREFVELRVHAPAHLFEDRRARVVHPVDAVAEAHELDLSLARVAHPLLGPVRGADELQLLDHRSGCPAVRRSLERSDGADQRGDEV